HTQVDADLQARELPTLDGHVAADVGYDPGAAPARTERGPRVDRSKGPQIPLALQTHRHRAEVGSVEVGLVRVSRRRAVGMNGEHRRDPIAEIELELQTGAADVLNLASRNEGATPGNGHRVGQISPALVVRRSHVDFEHLSRSRPKLFI